MQMPFFASRSKTEKETAVRLGHGGSAFRVSSPDFNLKLDLERSTTPCHLLSLDRAGRCKHVKARWYCHIGSTGLEKLPVLPESLG